MQLALTIETYDTEPLNDIGLIAAMRLSAVTQQNNAFLTKLLDRALNICRGTAMHSACELTYPPRPPACFLAPNRATHTRVRVTVGVPPFLC